jgi:GT2 family glycosyltransferase
MDLKNKFDYSIVFLCYNQIEYTKKCIESMVKNKEDLSRLVVIDNASTDNTKEYLESLPIGDLILNKTNLGIGTAFNQGILSFQSEWTIIINNDVIVSKNWIDNLLTSAVKNNLKVISSALIEGDLDYNFESFALKASSKMKEYICLNARQAVCMAIHESVWREVGYFRATPKLLGYEDTLFFHELDQAGIKTAITGSSWLHHFGSITQSAMKKERGMKNSDSLADRHNSNLLQQSWINRKLEKIRKKKLGRKCLAEELNNFDMSLHGIRENNHFKWQHFF